MVHSERYNQKNTCIFSLIPYNLKFPKILSLFKKQVNVKEQTYLHHQLMSSRHQREAIGMIKCLRNILPQGVTSSSRRYNPTSTFHLDLTTASHTLDRNGELFVDDRVLWCDPVYLWLLSGHHVDRSAHPVIGSDILSSDRKIVKKICKIFLNSCISVVS